MLGRGVKQNRAEKRGAAHPCPARPVPLGGSCPKQDAAGPGIVVGPAPAHCRAGPGKSSPKLEAAPSGCRGRAASGRWDEPGCRIQQRGNNPQTRGNNNYDHYPLPPPRSCLGFRGMRVSPWHGKTDVAVPGCPHRAASSPGAAREPPLRELGGSGGSPLSRTDRTASCPARPSPRGDPEPLPVLLEQGTEGKEQS